MHVEQVDFVSVPTRDVPRAVAWYRDVLGLPESEFSGGEVETSNVTLGFWLPEDQGEPFVANENGIALRVPDVDRRRRGGTRRGWRGRWVSKTRAFATWASSKIPTATCSSCIGATRQRCGEP